jgi:hypothetical protein
MKITLTKLTVLFVFLFSYIQKTSAQNASGIPHLFSVSPTAAPAFPGGAANIILTAPPRTDEWDTLFTPGGGWNFTFAGTTYNKVVLSSNGWLALIPNSVTSIPASIPNAMPNNDLSNNTTGYPIIAPLWDDLATLAISHVVSGGAYWVRWTLKWDKNNGSSSPLVFAKLDATNSTITYYYSSNSTYVPTSPSASIGIAGVCPGDFYSVYSTSNNTAYVDSVTENTTIGTGAPNGVRPYTCSYIFTPYSSNDNCASAQDLGVIGGSCTPVLGSTINAITSGSAICSGEVKDVYFKIIKRAGAT